MADYRENRRLLNYPWPSREEWADLRAQEDQTAPQPPIQKPAPDDAKLIDLVAPDDLTLGAMPLIDAINRRRSRRDFAATAITGEELSFLLWATQGVREVVREGEATMRTVPSGGARHPFETYLVANRVDGLEPGLYRYLAVDHMLCLLSRGDYAGAACTGCRGQPCVQQSAVTFVWTAIPRRTEWRYMVVSHKLIALDAGHVCQNLYLAAEAIECGTCAIAAYNQAKMDAVVGVDGDEEFVLYVAPVGKIA